MSGNGEILRPLTARLTYGTVFNIKPGLLENNMFLQLAGETIIFNDNHK